MFRPLTAAELSSAKFNITVHVTVRHTLDPHIEAMMLTKGTLDFGESPINLFRASLITTMIGLACQVPLILVTLWVKMCGDGDINTYSRL